MTHPELIVEENVPFRADLSAPDVNRLSSLLGGAWQQRHSDYVASRIVGHVALPSGLVLRIRSKKAPLASVMAWSAFVDPLMADLQALGELSGFQKAPSAPRTADNEDYVDRQPRGRRGWWRLDDLSPVIETPMLDPGDRFEPLGRVVKVGRTKWKK